MSISGQLATRLWLHERLHRRFSRRNCARVGSRLMDRRARWPVELLGSHCRMSGASGSGAYLHFGGQAARRSIEVIAGMVQCPLVRS